MKKTSPIIGAIQKVMPAVVSIAIAKHLSKLEESIGKEFLQMGALPPGPIEIPEELVDKRGMVQIGGGSGFFISADGKILTNRHVISDPDSEYKVIWQGKTYDCKILARDPINDVAILKIDAGKVPFVELGDSIKLELGEPVVAVGNALGEFSNTATSGIISGLSRSIRAFGEFPDKAQDLRGLIQTDAAINPGNSGGPLVNLKGEAIAINTAVVFGAQNIGFAIPINYAKRDLQDLEKYGRIKKPFLGVRYIILDDKLKEKHDLPFSYGAYVMHEHQPEGKGIIAGGPADEAGIKEGDILLECDGEKISVSHTIQDILEDKKVGEHINFKVWRRGQELNASITLAERK